MIDAGGGKNLLTQVVGGGLAEQGLAAAGRPVEEKAFGDVVLETLE